MALVLDMVHNWRDIPADVNELIAGADLYHQKGDVLPGLYQFLSYSHVLSMRHHLGGGKHSPKDIMEAQFYDISWNGEPIA